MIKIEGKTVEQSRVNVGNLMQPGQANQAGNVHGGEIMKLMDNAAGIVALRHSKTNVVTARVDELEFILPIHIGNLVTCDAKLTYVGTRSMEILVTVWVEDLTKVGPPKVALKAYFTMVSLDDSGKSSSVPPLIIKTKEEQKLFDEGEKRYLAYKQKRSK